MKRTCQALLLCGLACGLLLSSLGNASDQAQEPPTEIVRQEKLIIGGSSSSLAATHKLAAVFDAPTASCIEIPASLGSGGAIRATANGSIALGLISRALTPAEKDMGLTAVPYARAGLAVAVNPSVPDQNITAQELVQIYAGEKTAWSNGATIAPLLLQGNKRTNAVLAQAIPGLEEAMQDALQENRCQVYFNLDDYVAALKETPNAIGFVDFHTLSSESIKPLSLNGIEPTNENLLSGRYPLHKTLRYVYRSSLTPDARAFIDFTFSPAGQAVLLANNFIPLPR